MVMAKRELQFNDGKSQKFWTISLKGTSHTVTFGRIGTSGQTRTKHFDTKEEAIAYAERNGLGYTVFEPQPRRTIIRSYADNFRYGRLGRWTH